MKNMCRYILVAFAIVFVVLIAFCFDAVAAPDVPTMQTNKPFVLRNNAGNETAYYTLTDAMNALQGKSGNFTLYLMRDYDASSESTVTQSGDYNLLVRSGQEGKIFTLTNRKDFHFIIDFSVKNTYNDIVLDGGATDENSKTGGGLFIDYKAQVTIGKGCTVQRCTSRMNGYYYVAPIRLGYEQTKLIIKDGAKIINNYSSDKSATGLIDVSFNATVQIFDSLVQNNICSGMMSAPVIRMTQNGLLEIKNSKFIGNQGVYGGVIANYGGKISISDSEFIGNIGSYGGGAIYNDLSTTFDLKNCTFKNNISGGHGGAVLAEYCDEFNVNDCVFDYNLSGAWGGAIHFEDVKDAKINNCTFNNNSAYTQGGALNISSSKVSISNSTLSNNGTTGELEGLKLHPTYGGAILIFPGSSLDIQNCKFTGNSAKRHGGAIFTFNYSGMGGGYDEEQKDSIDDLGRKTKAYSNITIDSKTIFADNNTSVGYSLPPKNYKELSNLSFKSNSFTGKGYPSKMHVTDSLLNNYDINYYIEKFIYGFNANGGRFSDDTSERVSDILFPKDVYTIFSDVPQKGKFEFMGWQDEEGILHQPSEKLPPATRNRLFVAKWQEPATIETPQTGDTSNMALYVVLAVVAVGIFAFIIIKNIKNKENTLSV